MYMYREREVVVVRQRTWLVSRARSRALQDVRWHLRHVGVRYRTLEDILDLRQH